ncbi:MAG: hypothetical protein RMZ41_001505 [Nostoc sp. DedVER02]|uniref:hypothetical protein n=1 Tax=Nostoc sp. DedVER02 TaxID=3075405 RepID=UPI00391C29CD
MRYELRSNTTPVTTTDSVGNVPSLREAAPTGSPVAYGGKPAVSAGFTATHWLLYNA